MLSAFEGRVKKEICDKFGYQKMTTLRADEKRKYAVWRGGAKLATQPHFQSNWISRKEYLEFGDSIFYRKTVF